ncbi:hypothetical protein OG943_07865 [Amycolatopsis sp. NBC_00345]|uniref:hypothetical protein n=1 Tax=Amycolatopsis sp. NBC_00345 TaxID=2975955 RepID=UPI002E26A9C6
MLLWASTATVTVTTASRDWLVPPADGIWIPGGAEHAVATLQAGELSIVLFVPGRCPVTWSEPAGVGMTPLLRDLILHLNRTGAGRRNRAGGTPKRWSSTAQWRTHVRIRAAARQPADGASVNATARTRRQRGSAGTARIRVESWCRLDPVG